MRVRVVPSPNGKIVKLDSASGLWLDASEVISSARADRIPFFRLSHSSSVSSLVPVNRGTRHFDLSPCIEGGLRFIDREYGPVLIYNNYVYAYGSVSYPLSVKGNSGFVTPAYCISTGKWVESPPLLECRRGYFSLGG